VANVTSVVCARCKRVAAPLVDLVYRGDVFAEVRACRACIDETENELDAWRPWFRKLLARGYSRTAANRIMIHAMRAEWKC
jgi:hypothetical protein